MRGFCYKVLVTTITKQPGERAISTPHRRQGHVKLARNKGAT